MNSNPRKILLTGGTGYIGSHTCLSLLSEGYEAVIVDNLSNSKLDVLERLKKLSGRDIGFYKADIRDKPAIRNIFSSEKIDAVIHFAGLKAVGESVAHPLMYYDNNVNGTIALCEVMAEFGVKNIVFSSSATVYGESRDGSALKEDSPICPQNPYGRSKAMVESILTDLHKSDGIWNVALLRYFNPVGAHLSGEIGEDPNGIPNNLMPFICQVAVGRLPHLNVFGDDYPTPDGTGVRDYIHVVDLASGHVKALSRIFSAPGLITCNLGTGRGYSVLEVVKAFEKASGRKIPCKITARRPGDAATCYADPSRANAELKWSADRGIDEMCEDSWRWQSMNPSGYS